MLVDVLILSVRMKEDLPSYFQETRVLDDVKVVGDEAELHQQNGHKHDVGKDADRRRLDDANRDDDKDADWEQERDGDQQRRKGHIVVCEDVRDAEVVAMGWSRDGNDVDCGRVKRRMEIDSPCVNFVVYMSPELSWKVRLDRFRKVHPNRLRMEGASKLRYRNFDVQGKSE